MKAPVRDSRGGPQLQSEKRGRDYAVFMFKTHKETAAGAGGTRTSDFLSRRSRGGLPRAVLLRLVSAEASRLSRSNRVKVVTLQELQEAVKLVRRSIRARPAA